MPRRKRTANQRKKNQVEQFNFRILYYYETLDLTNILRPSPPFLLASFFTFHFKNRFHSSTLFWVSSISESLRQRIFLNLCFYNFILYNFTQPHSLNNIRNHFIFHYFSWKEEDQERQERQKFFAKIEQETLQIRGYKRIGCLNARSTSENLKDKYIKQAKREMEREEIYFSFLKYLKEEFRVVTQMWSLVQSSLFLLQIFFLYYLETFLLLSFSFDDQCLNIII